ncbi:MAG TPA: hypothetical protein VMT00_11245 [Thermoanaerobaculia bacterium]|nr:hypothetical protein [Thermoanaerobaculia bacterium]
MFLSLDSPEEAIARVGMRVRHRGHNVDAEVVRRRFASGIRNFLEIYRHHVDYWQWFDNSGRPPLLIEEGRSR